MELNDNGEVVGSANERKLSRMEELANEADALRDDDLHDVAEDGAIEPVTEEVEETEVPVVEVVVTEPEVRKKKLKINGIEREFTDEQIEALAAKTASADEYLANAKRLFEETQARAQPSKDVDTSEDDLQLARALQMGDEQEAARVIRQLRAKPSFDQDAIAAGVTDKIRFQEASDWFKEEYKDIMADKDLLNIAINRDAEMAQSGDSRSYRERYKEIGDSLRAKFLKPVNDLQTKQERKASTVRVLPTASARSGTEAVEEPDDSPRAVVAQMAAARGQR
jgi:hypothetical protein